MFLLSACISYIRGWYLPNTSEACFLLHLRTLSVLICAYYCAFNLVCLFSDGIGSYQRLSLQINCGICLSLTCGNGVAFQAQIVRVSLCCCDNKG